LFCPELSECVAILVQIVAECFVYISAYGFTLSRRYMQLFIHVLTSLSKRLNRTYNLQSSCWCFTFPGANKKDCFLWQWSICGQSWKQCIAFLWRPV